MLKPVDLQTILPRSVELQRIQHAQNTRPVSDQQDFSRELLLRTQVSQEQVQQSESSGEQNQVRDDQSESRKRRFRRFGQEKKDDTETETSAKDATDIDRGQHIDIKI